MESLEYEETPIIEPIPEPPRRSLFSTIGTAILFITLFVIGVGLSVLLRRFLEPQVSVPTSTQDADVPTPSLSVTAVPTIHADPYANWRDVQVVSGTTKLSVPGVSFKIPPEMLAPICDGASCASQGTYLPNGTRFTIAARGKGQLLVDARGAVAVTDSSGKSFTSKQVILAGGRKALEYTGLFSGTTVGGYTFSQMRGLMIEIDEDETLEMNHFTPSGVGAEFAKDDEMFDKIVASLTVARFPATEK